MRVARSVRATRGDCARGGMLGMRSLILLVEDDRDIRESLVEALEDEGHATITAIDGIDAIAQLRNSSQLPDLILLDLMMPRMSGVEFCEQVKRVPAWAHIPIVVITANADARQKAADLGAAGFLRKPLQLAMLTDIAARFSRANGAERGS